MSRKLKLAVIGNGMAAVRLLETLQARAPDRYQIDVFGEEPEAGYNRVLLSPLLAGEQSETQIATRNADWYRECGITLHRGQQVTAIDRGSRILRCADGSKHSYDRLVLATGSRAFIPDLPGADLPGSLGFRTLADVRRMLAHAALHPDETVTVVGGGLLGIEAACALAKRGVQVRLLHRGNHLMNRQLDSEAGGLLASELAQRGIEVHCNSEIAAVLGDTRVEGVRLRGGRSTLASGMVIWGAGIVPEADLARDAGLDCSAGVRVDHHLRSSDPMIFAIGECAEFNGETFGLVAPSYGHAEICAAVLAGDMTPRYAPSAMATRLKVSGVEVFSMGVFEAGPDDEQLHYRDSALGIYRKLVLRDGRLIGALCYGDARDAGWYEQLISAGKLIGPMRSGLAFGETACEQLRAA